MDIGDFVGGNWCGGNEGGVIRDSYKRRRMRKEVRGERGEMRER